MKKKLQYLTQKLRCDSNKVNKKISLIYSHNWSSNRSAEAWKDPSGQRLS